MATTKQLLPNTYYKLGTIGTINNIRVVVDRATNNCDDCLLNNLTECYSYICSFSFRKDRKEVIFKVIS